MQQTNASQPLQNDKHEAFCREYLIDFNATQSAIRAGYSGHTAGSIGHALLKKVEISERISVLRDASFKRLDGTADDVMRRWWDVATADANELSQHRIGACRYCWGIDHAYQWRTKREYADAVTAWSISRTAPKDNTPADPADNLPKELPMPSDEGGYGYRRSMDPNSVCPECDGQGDAYVVFSDTTKLSPAARLLYAGVKVTSTGGKEILTASREKALEHVARRLGLTKETVQHDLGGFGSLLDAIKAGRQSAAPIIPAGRALPDDDEGDE